MAGSVLAGAWQEVIRGGAGDRRLFSLFDQPRAGFKPHPFACLDIEAGKRL
jgi:hypothetical protein